MCCRWMDGGSLYVLAKFAAWKMLVLHDLGDMVSRVCRREGMNDTVLAIALDQVGVFECRVLGCLSYNVCFTATVTSYILRE